MRHFRSFGWLAIIGIFTIFLAPAIFAQDNPNFETGLKPFGSYQGGNIDTIDLLNFGESIDIPLMSYPQKGGKLKLAFSLHFVDAGYYYTVGYIYDDYGNVVGTTTNWQNTSPIAGWTIRQDGIPQPQIQTIWTSTTQGYETGSITMSDGAVHQMAPLSFNGPWRTTDGSGFVVPSSGPTTDSDGIAYTDNGQYVFGSSGGGIYGLTAQTIQDANGNTISTTPGSGNHINGWTDTVGRNIGVPYAQTNLSRCPSIPSPPTSAVEWDLLAPNGGTYPLLFCSGGSVPYSYYFWNTNSGQGTGWQDVSSGSGPVLQSLVLPDNTYWTFQYTTDGYQNLSQVTFPTGGNLCYTWTNPSINRGDYFEQDDYVATRKLDPGACSLGSPTWTYTTVSGPSGIVTDPAGNDTVHTFTNIPNSFSTLETQTQYYQGSHSGGTLLKTVNTSYTSTAPAAGQNGFISPGAVATQVSTTWPSAQSSQLNLAYDGGFQAGEIVTNPVSGQWEYSPLANVIYGKQLTSQEYDYGGSLLRTTSTTYQFQNNSSYLNANLLNLPASVQVSGAGPGSYMTYGYDESNCASGACGNQTSVHRWLNTTGGYLVTSSAFDSNGRVTSVTDPKGNPPTKYGYSSSTCPNSWSGTYAGSGPTCVTNPLNQSTLFNYDLDSGLQLSVTDPNNQPTYTHYDQMLRTTEIDYPDGGQTLFGYPNATEVQVSEKINTGGVYKTTNLLVDGLGRLSQTQLTSDPDNPTYTLTQYDGMGRKYKVYNPTRCSAITTNCGESTWGYTTFQYDALSRVNLVTDQDGSTVSTDYSAFPCVTVTDEASKNRQSCTDGLGRLTSVTENPGGLNYLTSYSYDALDNLTGVTQAGSHQRSFTYDSLSRLTVATNPESGTICYGAVSGGVCQQNGYDANGNLVTRTDARGIITCFGNLSGSSCDGNGYDALNRVTKRTYSDGTPSAIYSYDQSAPWGFPVSNYIGRLTSFGTNNGGSQNGGWIVDAAISYDPMGRMALYDQCIIGTCGTATSVYDLLGDITSLTYPSGRVVKTYYVTGGKTAARPTQVTFDNYNGTSVGYNYLSAAHYAPDGSPANTTLGNGATEASTYNNRLQPCNQQIATGASTWVNRSYSFYPTPSCTGSSGNNGNVMQIADGLQNGRTQNFGYDALNRLTSAATQATSGPNCWGNSYGYDPWGNLTQQNVTQCSGPYMNLSVDANNHITNSGFGYDLAGNMTMNNGIAYQYDAESRLFNYASGAGVYTYDASGNRVQKQAGGTTTDYIYFGGQPIAEYNPATGDWSDYIYAGARRLVRDDTYSSEMDIGGTNSTTSQATVFGLANAGGLSGYTIQSGDKLSFDEYEWSGTEAGMGITFTDSTNTSWSVTDQFGDYMNRDMSGGTARVRTFDLSGFAGKQVYSVNLISETGTAAAPWGAAFLQISLVSADGTVHTIYNNNPSYGISLTWTSGATGITYGTNTFHGRYQSENLTANYYHGDHLGSSRLMTDGSGWPVWQDTFLPFGEEWNPQFTTNNYKFTGKERDSESGLDNFGARYNSSQLGRFMSPDPGPAGIAMRDPQSWNLYSYVENRPTAYVDDNGLWATPVHVGMVNTALGDYVSAGQLLVLDRAQVRMDMFEADPGNANDHALRQPGQSVEDAVAGIMDSINWSLSEAQKNLKSDGSFTDSSLEWLGSAVHTLEDSTSPAHVNALGLPLGTPVGFRSDIQHFFSEISPSQSWIGWGLGVRLTAAAAVVVSPEYMGSKGVTIHNVNRIVDDEISRYIFLNAPLRDMSPQQEEATRQCAMGNSAACDNSWEAWPTEDN